MKASMEGGEHGNLPGLARRLHEKLGSITALAATGRGVDLEMATQELQETVAGFERLHMWIVELRCSSAPRLEAVAECSEQDMVVGTVSRELASCWRMVKNIEQLIRQGHETRLAHWTRQPEESYTSNGARTASGQGPHLVRHLA